MRKSITLLILMLTLVSLHGQSYLVGPTSPAVGSSINYTSHNHYNLFNVLNPTGIYIDSLTIYPSTASTAFTIVIQNSSQTQIASFTGTTTVGGNAAERIKVDLFVPMGTGYRLGLTTGSVGMLRNSDGITFPYTVPNVVSFTGATYGTTYWYFFYNLRVHLPVTATDAGIVGVEQPQDSVCSGMQPVQVMLKNFGPSTLTETNIEWSVNNVAQTPYQWTGNVGIMDSTLVTIGQYPFLTGTTYTISANTSQPNSVADTINQNDTASVAGIVVKTAPTVNTTTTSLDLCEGDTAQISFTLTGSPPWNLSFETGTSTIPFNNIMNGNFVATFTPSITTTYTLDFLSDASGCVVDPMITIPVNVFPAPPATISLPGGSSNACFGDSVKLMATLGSGFTYQWFKDGVSIPGALDYEYYAKQAGAYTVLVTSLFGCSATSAPVNVMIYPAPVVNIGNDTALLPNQNINLDAGSGFSDYYWSDGSTNQTLWVDSAGTGIGVKTVWVRVTDNNGCMATDTIHINFTNHPGIAEVKKGSAISLYPNPANEKIGILVSGCTEEMVKAEIFSMTGLLMDSGLLRMKDGTIIMDVSEIPSGQYLIRISAGSFNEVSRFVIVK